METTSSRVQAVIQRAANLTPQEVEAIAHSEDVFSLGLAELSQAAYKLLPPSMSNVKELAFDAVWKTHSRRGRAIAGVVAADTACALAVRNQITRKDFDRLTNVWVKIIGSVW